MSYALITGASRGIGRAIAEELARRKIDVLLVARDQSALEVLCSELHRQYGIQAHYFIADLSQADAAYQVFDWCQQHGYAIQYLVNNAGYGLSGKFERYALKDHLEMMKVNMNTVVELCYLFLPLLKKHPSSYILNVSSSAAYQAVPYLGIYAASKSFVLQFSRALHYELKKDGVVVTCVSPGSTDTNFAHRAQVGEKAMKMAKKVNMQADEVARIAVDAMFKGKAEVVTGLLNKLGAFMAWLLPKKTVEKASAKIYE
jgi:hypothetical protein